MHEGLLRANTSCVRSHPCLPLFCAERGLTQQKANVQLLALSGTTVRLYKVVNCTQGLKLTADQFYMSKAAMGSLSLFNWTSQFARWGCQTSYAYWQYLVLPWLKTPLVRLRPYIPQLLPLPTRLNQPTKDVGF